jgi:hypothetical protein
LGGDDAADALAAPWPRTVVIVEVVFLADDLASTRAASATAASSASSSCA